MGESRICPNVAPALHQRCTNVAWSEANFHPFFYKYCSTSQLLPGLLGQVKTTLQLAPSSVPSIEGATSYRLSPIFLDYDSPLSGPVTQQQDSRTQLKELQAGRLVMVLLQCLATWGSHQFIWVKTLSRKRKSCT